MARKPPFFRSSGTPSGAPNVVQFPWQKSLQTRRGAPRSNLHNALLMLQHHPTFAGRLRYNEFERHKIIDDHWSTDVDTIQIQAELQKLGLIDVGPGTTRDAIDAIAHASPFHPVRDWLDGLVWDGTPRLAQWLHTCVGAEDNEYHRVTGACFLKSMVARIYEPGCKVDYMLVLEGQQRTLKSSVCRVLGGEWFSDQLPDLIGDRTRLSMLMRGKWLLEISELSSFFGSSSERLKHFVSSQIEQYIPKYGRAPEREPRTCVFIGTTNNAQYLHDETGGTRFWPVPCGTINLNWLTDNREQLFAEAAAEYQRVRRWWPDPDFERAHIAPVQDERYEADPWEPAVADWVRGRATATVLQIANMGLGMATDRLGTRDGRRITAILRRLGWRQHRGTNGTRSWMP